MTKPRDLYDLGTHLKEDDGESYTQCTPSNSPPIGNVNVIVGWRRTDIQEDDGD